MPPSRRTGDKSKKPARNVPHTIESSTRYADAARRAVTEDMLEQAPPPPPDRPQAQNAAASSSGSAQRPQEPEDIDWPEVRGPNGILLLASDRQRNVPPTTERLCSSDYQDADNWMDLALEEPDNHLLLQVLRYAQEKRVSFPVAVALTRGLLTDEDQASEGGSSRDEGTEPVSILQEAIALQEATADSIDVRNRDLVNMWITILIVRDNDFTPVEDLIESTLAEGSFPGEGPASVRTHVSSQLSQNWELFDVKIRHEMKYVRLWPHVYHEAKARQQADLATSAQPASAYDHAPGTMPAPPDATTEMSDVTVLPKSVESISAKQTQESAPKPRLLDERSTTPNQFVAGLTEWRGKHYPPKAIGLNTRWSVEGITHYMQNLPKETDGKVKAAPTFHPSECPIFHAIHEFIKSLQLACSDPDSPFWFPDCNINALQSLATAVHMLAPGQSVWIQNRRKPPEDMKDRSTYFHGCPASRALNICKSGLAPCMGAGYETLEHAYGQPVLGAYVAKMNYAIHYPLSECTKTDAVPECRTGVSGSQLISDDGTPPLRCLIVLCGDPRNQLWHRHNQSLFPVGNDPNGVPYLFIKHICFYATSPRLMMKFYKDLLCVECKISPTDEQTIRRWDDVTQALLDPVSTMYEECCRSNTVSPLETNCCEPDEDDKSTWSTVHFPPMNVTDCDVNELKGNFLKHLEYTHPSLLEHGEYSITHLYKQKDDSFFSHKKLLELRQVNYAWKHWAGSFLTGDWFGREKDIPPFNHYSLRSVEDAYMEMTKHTKKRPLHLFTVEKVARSATMAVVQHLRALSGVEYDRTQTTTQRLQLMLPEDMAKEHEPAGPAYDSAGAGPAATSSGASSSAVVNEASSSAAAGPAHQCDTPGCSRESWNGQAGQSCCRTCSNTAGSQHGPACNQKFSDKSVEDHMPTTNHWEAEVWDNKQKRLVWSPYPENVSEDLEILYLGVVNGADCPSTYVYEYTKRSKYTINVKEFTQTRHENGMPTGTVRPICRVVAAGTSVPADHSDLSTAATMSPPMAAQAALSRIVAERGIDSIEGLARLAAEADVQPESEPENNRAESSQPTGQDTDAQPRRKMWSRDENRNWELVDEEPFETYQQYQARTKKGATKGDKKGAGGKGKGKGEKPAARDSAPYWVAPMAPPIELEVGSVEPAGPTASIASDEAVSRAPPDDVPAEAPPPQEIPTGAPRKRKSTDQPKTPEEKAAYVQKKQAIRWIRVGLAIQCPIPFCWYGDERGRYEVPTVDFDLQPDTDWSFPPGTDNRLVNANARCVNDGLSVERDLQDEVRSVAQSRIARQATREPISTHQPLIEVVDRGPAEMLSMADKHAGFVQMKESQIDPNSFGAIYLSTRIGSLNQGRAPTVEHTCLQSYAANNPLATHVRLNAQLTSSLLRDKVATYTEGVNFKKATIASAEQGTFPPFVPPSGASQISSDEDMEFRHGMIEPARAKKQRVDEFLNVMQSSNHKGIVTGSSSNDFQPDDSVSANISTPFNAGLAPDDKFEEPEPAVVEISERVPVSVQQAMIEGDYVETRSAPVVMAAQKLVRDCFIQVWNNHRQGRCQTPIMDLEAHTRWSGNPSSNILYGNLRKIWKVVHLEEVLREYVNQFIVTTLPPKKNWVRESGIATHAWSSRDLMDPDPRKQIVVSLVRFTEDPLEVNAAVNQITGHRLSAGQEGLTTASEP